MSQRRGGGIHVFVLVCQSCNAQLVDVRFLLENGSALLVSYVFGVVVDQVGYVL